MASTSKLIGMHADTGLALVGVEHVAQSIAVVLFTPVGSRVMRKGFGSVVPDLIDAPDNALTRVRLYAAVATALMRWVPNIKLSNVALESVADTPGAAEIVITGIYIDPEGVPQNLSLRYQLSTAAT